MSVTCRASIAPHCTRGVLRRGWHRSLRQRRRITLRTSAGCEANAPYNATGATVREYIWLPEAEIAPTRQSRAQVDIPLAVVDAVNTTPVILNVHADHLGRPVKMTNSAKASVWDVVYTPWGAPHTLTGAQTLNERFPGQWFQLESGLHYNWHRHYDPSLGRYTQPDPLGFVDGPGVYGYAGGSPLRYVDKDGRLKVKPGSPISMAVQLCLQALLDYFAPPPPPPEDPPPPPEEPRCKYTGERYFSGDCKTCIYQCKGYGAPVTFPQEKDLKCMGFSADGLVDTSQIGPKCRY